MAALSGVTLRTLHYYDEIGILCPSKRTDAGYRLYETKDLHVLQQILFLRELGFPLATIKQMLHTPGYDRVAELERQAELLEQYAKRYQQMAKLARETLIAEKGEKTMKDNALFEGLNQQNIAQMQAEYEAEVKKRWGSTEAYQTSAKRTSSYDEKEWRAIQDAQNEIYLKLAQCMNEGLAPERKETQALVEAARTCIDQYFYPCDKEMMQNLGELYISDPRFAQYFESIAEGLSTYFHSAIACYCS